jgi:hemerythrin
MILIEWQDEFKIGIAEVDHEHQEMIALINELHGAINADASYDRVVESLGDIYAHIAAHFALEEKMMRRSHYPAYGEHKQDHETLLDDLRDIMDEIEDDGTFDQTRLSNDLHRWFSEHFQTHDAKLHRPTQAAPS